MKIRTSVSILLVLNIFFLSCDTGVNSKKESGKTNKETFDTLNRDQLLIFNSLETNVILKRLFDNPDFDSLNMAVWKPNYLDLTSSLSIPLSFDKRFHTSLDTILYFTDTEKRKCAVAILATYNFQYNYLDTSKVEITGCHSCGASIGAALFHETIENRWEIYKFQKEISQIGHFGIYKTNDQYAGKIQLKEIGDKWTCLSLTDGLSGNGGYLEGDEQLYSIEEFGIGGMSDIPLNNIFLNAYGFKEEFLNKKIDLVIKSIKKPGGYYDILAKTVNGMTVRTRYYKYSKEFKRYIHN